MINNNFNPKKDVIILNEELEGVRKTGHGFQHLHLHQLQGQSRNPHRDRSMPIVKERSL